MRDMKKGNLRIGFGLGVVISLAGCVNDTVDPGGLSAGTGGTGNVDDSTGTPSPSTTIDPSVGTASSNSDGSTASGEDTIDPSIGESTAGDSGSSGGEEEGSSSTGEPPECTMHTDCDPGNMCENEVCVAGCTAGAPCPGGQDCCGGTCVDLQTDADHCMACDNACPTPPNIDAFCEGGTCQLGDCDAGFFECDGQGATGCEADEMCLCNPGDMESCYPGPAGTEGVGICAAGVRTCEASGTDWSACTGFTLPIAEVCENGADDDCDNAVDNIDDVDGDGWTICNGDCCETEVECSDPPLVNPGAFEFIGNLVDDDCNAASSDAVAPADCSTMADFSALTGTQLAQAMDLCQFTTANPPLENRTWGVISAELVTPAGAAPGAGQLSNMQNWQAAVLANYGTVIGPVVGPTMAGISSGRMRDENDANYVVPNNGTDFNHDQNPPAAYLAANGGSLPSSDGCGGGLCPAGTGANDGINLRLTIRVPTNALSFRYRFRYFTSEYWTFQCDEFNDFYLALLTSGAAGIPADGNISFDSLGNAISVNNGFFDVCDPDGGVGCNTCPEGIGDLNGTGMETGGCLWCGDATGGGTVWLETSAPVVPGEQIVLQLMVFDVSDNILDSLSILDGFEWDIDPSEVGTEPQ
jgi:hypothetical protein